jgi:two-component system, cell cycle response regulator DivK
MEGLMSIALISRKRRRAPRAGSALRLVMQATLQPEFGGSQDPNTAWCVGEQDVAKETEVPLILVVDDFADAREMLVEYLEGAGYRTTEAVYGIAAIAQATRYLPQLILMDLGMPGLDGWEATRRLRANPLTRLIPIVAVTAHVLLKEELQAMEAGCDRFITKPVNLAKLLAVIANLLRGQAN